jgi:hypothetical protein
MPIPKNIQDILDDCPADSSGYTDIGTCYPRHGCPTRERVRVIERAGYKFTRDWSDQSGDEHLVNEELRATYSTNYK